MYADFAKLYRRYKAFNRKAVGDISLKKRKTWLKSSVTNLKPPSGLRWSHKC